MKNSLYQTVLDLITDKHISMDRLAFMAGTDTRTVRKIVSDARINDEVILSDSTGYYRPQPQDLEKLRHFYNARRRSALTTLRGLKSTKQLIRKLETDKAMENMEDIAESLTDGKKDTV